MSVMAEGKRKGVKGITDGINLAKNVFAVHAVDDNGKLLLVKPKVAPKDLALHCTRHGFVEERTALYNRPRRLVSEFGIVLLQNVACLRREIGATSKSCPGRPIAALATSSHTPAARP